MANFHFMHTAFVPDESYKSVHKQRPFTDLVFDINYHSDNNIQDNCPYVAIAHTCRAYLSARC